MFGSRIAGVSLRAPCRMRFQRAVQGERSLVALALAPRSAYVLSGKARWWWQHSIPDEGPALLRDVPDAASSVGAVAQRGLDARPTRLGAAADLAARGG
jgi:hypothetical protein